MRPSQASTDGAIRASSLLVLLLLALLAAIANSAASSPPYSTPSSSSLPLVLRETEKDQCFCQLSGKVDDCCCDVETVDLLNNGRIHAQISALLENRYFQFFRVNLERTCPFWADDGMCASKDCAIAPCSDNEVPQGIREFEMKHGRSAACESIETATIGLGSIDSSVSHTESSVLAEWSAYDDSADTFCELDDENDAGLQYINLKRNPERYTGYMGPSANRIWRAIYQENCFLDNPSSGDGADGRTGAESSDGYSQDQMAALLTNAAGSPMSSGPRDPVPMQEILGNMCIERRVFYRVISGLHSSISIHLTHQYFDKTLRQYVPNLEDFARRFGPTHTAGEGPSRLKNLYFTYLLLLRAVTKARSVWQAESFFTGNPTEDASVKAQIDQLVSTSLTCPSTFDERIMFAGDPAMARIMKAEFREHFRNVSRIMDCVGCDKCRLWGKIQTQGIATALKILFSAHLDEDDQAPLDSADLTPDVQDDPAAIKPQQQQQQHQQQQQQQQQHQKQQQTARRRLNLRRSEIVSLFNTLGRLSESLKAVEDFRLMTKDAFSIPSPVQGAETWMEMLV